MHIIATRPTILPYYDMVWLIISHYNVQTYNVINSSQHVVGSFKPKNVFNMHKSEPPKENIEKQFIDKFELKQIIKAEIFMPKLIRY